MVTPKGLLKTSKMENFSSASATKNRKLNHKK
jgi:hypothetical protein